MIGVLCLAFVGAWSRGFPFEPRIPQSGAWSADGSEMLSMMQFGSRLQRSGPVIDPEEDFDDIGLSLMQTDSLVQRGPVSLDEDGGGGERRLSSVEEFQPCYT
eukprot:CAMPEP_0204396148 /NCGR_PEP_ID=MMETSP0470-20130426/1168_1 /ASSEMBLY_ACC=CAM_ASM_000385 /TAXON_ID=2969 /ORGANISM="Oxyrrhis marina" /LENGTH=102 /DNA_ID=CAMNT_0051390363 /DNA_START=125 /DNA_END=429 /DNA_ORIENTATION=+